MLKIISILFVGLVLLGVISIAVDYYYYSWTSFVRPFGCEYKNIRAIYQQEKLEQEYDLSQIAEKLQSDPRSNFKIILSGGGLGVSQMFNDVKYVIGFQEYNSINGKYTKVNFHNINSDSYNNYSLSRKGEKPTTPDQYIRNNIYQMINEMPLNEAQKDELKSKVQISCSPTTKLTF